jgi:single-strand DNA-binding protein
MWRDPFDLTLIQQETSSLTMAIPTISDIAGITAPPELRFTPGGKSVLSIRLAFNDSKYDDQQSRWVTTKTFYVDAQAWEQTAERLAEQLSQGDQVYVTGRIETQSWEDKDGGKRSKPLLNVQSVRKLAKSEPAGSSRNNQNQGFGGGGNTQSGNNVPPQEDPWATPGVSNAGGWGNGPDSEPPF